MLAIVVDGLTHRVRELPAADGAFALEIDGRQIVGHRWADAARVWVRLEGRTFVFDRKVADDAGARRDGKSEVRSDMPGTVVALHTSVGATVTSGDPLVTIESMKLQIEILAERGGTVASMHVTANETFERGALLVVIAEEKA